MVLQDRSLIFFGGGMLKITSPSNKPFIDSYFVFKITSKQKYFWLKLRGKWTLRGCRSKIGNDMLYCKKYNKD